MCVFYNDVVDNIPTQGYKYHHHGLKAMSGQPSQIIENLYKKISLQYQIVVYHIV